MHYEWIKIVHVTKYLVTICRMVPGLCSNVIMWYLPYNFTYCGVQKLKTD